VFESGCVEQRVDVAAEIGDRSDACGRARLQPDRRAMARAGDCRSDADDDERNETKRRVLWGNVRIIACGNSRVPEAQPEWM